jgi:phosphotransacetylase
MPLASFDELFQQADARPAPVPVVAAGGADRTVLEALRAACDRGWVAPAVTGREEEIRRVVREADLDLRGFTMVDTDEPAAAAVARVRGGQARLLVKGQVATLSLLKGVLDPRAGLRTGRVLCQVVLLEVRAPGAAAPRRCLLADTGVCVAPTLEQKADILRGAAAVARALGEGAPRVAVLAATEQVSEAMPETGDAAELTRRGREGEFAGCAVQGPLSFDLAWAADAGARKQVSGAAVGAADVLLFPGLVSANLTVKPGFPR